MTQTMRLGFAGRIALAFFLSLMCLLGISRPAFASIDGMPVVVSMGDSFASGEGTEPFYDQDSPNRYQSDDFLAHRSKRAWPALLKVGDVSMQKDQNWFFVATSGAQTRHVLRDKLTIEWNRNGSSGRRDLPCQKEVFSDHDLKGKVDYITISIGGNDIYFADLIEAACTDIPLISTGSFEAKLEDALVTFENTTIGNLSAIYDLLEQEAGSQAVTITTGYPHLFDSDGRRVYLSGQITSSLIAVDASEAALIAAAVDTVDASIEEVVLSKHRDNLVYVDVRSYFEGHEEEYLNPIWNYEQTYDLQEGASHYSCHLNEQGQQAYARAVQAKIDQIEKDKPSNPEVKDVAMALVFDTSGSMDYVSAATDMTRLDSAKRQSKDFVTTISSSARENDNVSLKIGVSTFASEVTRACGLSSNPTTINNCIDKLSAWGLTDMYGGLADGIDQLSSQTGTKILVLLSDGKRNKGKGDADILALANEAAAAGIQIHTIGFGEEDELNVELLRQIAQVTGGTYAYQDASTLSAATVGLFATMMTAELQATSEVLITDTGTVTQGETAEVGTFDVNESGTVTAYLYGAGDGLDIQLIDPDGITVAEGYEGYEADNSDGSAKVTVCNAKLGTWLMSVHGREVSYEEEPFYVVASME